jgi:hypothetical protein
VWKTATTTTPSPSGDGGSDGGRVIATWEEAVGVAARQWPYVSWKNACHLKKRARWIRCCSTSCWSHTGPGSFERTWTGPALAALLCWVTVFRGRHLPGLPDMLAHSLLCCRAPSLRGEFPSLEHLQVSYGTECILRSYLLRPSGWCWGCYHNIFYLQVTTSNRGGATIDGLTPHECRLKFCKFVSVEFVPGQNQSDNVLG